MAQLGRLTHDDVEQAFALSRGVGWNQTPEDWARLLTLAPDGVFGAFDDGRLVATSSVVAYGDALAWIGMMIVEEGHRGRGLGKRLLDAALASPTITPGATVGLDATDLGAPLYRARGFVDAEPIDRWGGELRASIPREGTEVRTAGTADAAALADWDAARTGIDRRALIAHLLRTPSTNGWLATRGGELVGYAALRPGRTHRHLGPLLAEDETAFAALVAAAAECLTGTVVFADVVRSPAGDAAFARAGLRVERRLTRMTRAHPSHVLSGGPIWATAGLEWG
ncbi:MAG: GNAT family N-acetyltransferase [Trueperaceae bacterium]|nr:GNAT family N-acetyltransferase [Trueperaceae bacterium]